MSHQQRPGDHIHQRYDRELARLEAILGEMGGRCEQQLVRALDALEQRNEELARRVVAADPLLDALEREAEELVVRLFALRAPVAVDLRTVLGSLKIAAIYERIGDNAKHVAKRALALSEGPALAPVAEVVALGQAALAALHAVNGAVASRDDATAETVWREDAAVDRLHLAATAAISACSRANPGHQDPCIHLHFCAKALERIGDHATNLAEVVAFQVRGRRLPDDRPKVA